MDGAHIKHYTILRSLGRGGSAEVFLASDTKLGRLVALKRPFLRNAASVERLVSEARLLARLRHENTTIVYELNQYRGHPFMTLEYIEGQTVRDIARQTGASTRLALDVMIPVARALVHIHARDVIHRDLKPENIMVPDTGGIKIIDFGVAQLRAGLEFANVPKSKPKPKRKNSRAPIGTLRYMSPEQIRGDDVDHRADLWAAGILLYELAQGEHPLAPFRAGWHRKLSALDEPFPNGMTDRNTTELAEVIKRCLQKRPDERMATAADLLSALEKIAAHTSFQE